MRKLSWLSLLLVVFLVAGCGGGPAQPTSGPKLPSGEVFQIALPRIEIAIDAEGYPNVLGINPTMLSFLGVDTSAMRVPKETVDAMVQAGIQHFEIASVGDRIVLVANGKLLPHLGWNGASLAKLMDVLDVFQVQNAQLIRTLAEPITRLGLDVVVRFPLAPGEAAIPLADRDTVYKLALTPYAEAPSLIIKFEVRFDEHGQPSILGVKASDLMGPQAGEIRILQQDTLDKLRAGDIQHVELRTKPESAYIYVNGEALPQLIWDSALLGNLVELLGKLAPDMALLPLIQALAPYVDRADIGILLHFPLAPGAQAIPAQMHD